MMCVRVFKEEALLAGAMVMVEEINKRYDINARTVAIMR